MSELAIMPMTDYKDICDAIREGTNTTEPIKSGEAAGLIRDIVPDTCTLKIMVENSEAVCDVCSLQAVVYKNGIVDMYERRQTNTTADRLRYPLTIENVVCGSSIVILTWKPSFATTITLGLNGAEKITNTELTYINGIQVNISMQHTFHVLKITAAAGETATITITAISRPT